MSMKMNELFICSKDVTDENILQEKSVLSKA